MEIFQIVILAVISTLIIIVLKVQRPETALMISIVTGVIIFFVVLGKTSAIIELLKGYAEKANIDIVYFSTLLKIIGIAYIAEFGSEICKDAGESAIASKVELAGKVIIIILAVPIVTSLLDLVINIMP
ncbi:MAG: stage III sporulation protein AD [Clostridium sp.]|jgi:stage III sporulation protein AD|nr:stage III sporulation protein AD [Clostridium sp.]